MANSTDESASDKYVRVQVIDVEIPFISMVWLLVKVALAAIPAAFLLMLFAAIAGGIIAEIM